MMEFDTLPTEIKYYLITYFDSKSMQNFVYVSKYWHENEDAWELLCSKKGITHKKSEKRLSWRQLFTGSTAYIQVLSGWHCKSKHPRPKDIPLQKICMLGAGGVGLTAVLRQFLLEELFLKYDPTVEDTYFAEVIINGERRNLEITDTAGQEEYSALREQYIKTHKIFVYVFSVTAPSTFQAIDRLVGQTVHALEGNNFYGVLIGNKIDLADERLVSRAEGEQKAKMWGMPYMETTMYDRLTVTNAFGVLLKDLTFYEQPPETNDRKKRRSRSNKRKGCVIF